VLKGDTYPLSVSAERNHQAIALVEYAQLLGVSAIAHGSTAAGNDQVRFDMVFQTLAPELEILTPIRDLQLSREEEIEFLQKNGVDISFRKAKYSINKGLWGTSVGGAETLSSHLPLPEEAYPSSCSEKEPIAISISFTQGEPTALNGESMSPIDCIKRLNELGSAYALGRDIHVGDTIIGIKGRVGFEAPAALLLIKSHQLLEKHCLSKWQQHWKKQLADWYGMFLHEAMYQEPVMRNIECFLSDTQTNVSGTVELRLHPYRFELLGVKSGYDLMQADFGSYGEMNKKWTAADVKGFTRIYGNALAVQHSLQHKALKRRRKG
ncbi:MAG: argininosuccinate synthase domain-containing protein, partial [Luteibaculum sp.]